YHRPTDKAPLINIEGMRKVTDMAEDVVVELATDKARPEFIEVRRTGRPGGRPGNDFIPLGIRPDYDAQDGVLLEGVNEGGYGAKAGLKAGDRILEMNGKEVKNVETYMTVMRGLKRGDTLEMAVQRGKEKLKLKVKLD